MPAVGFGFGSTWFEYYIHCYGQSDHMGVTGYDDDEYAADIYRMIP